MAADLSGLYRRWLLELWNGDLEGHAPSDGLQLMAQLGALGPGA
jgi:hypothetical protein